jgi:hypothetical protein
MPIGIGASLSHPLGIVELMDAATHRDPLDPDRPDTAGSGQLRLLETAERPDWKLDDSTREVGRRGIAAARAALRTARRRGDGAGGSDGHGHPTAA